MEETYPSQLPVRQVAVYLAEKKARSLMDQVSGHEIVVAADTCVVLGDTLLGKPADEQQAFRMLQSLSGTTHEVITGVALMHQQRLHSFSEHTRVTFRSLADELIRYYVRMFRPLDKAGAYGIQEFIGYVGVVSVQGCYYNVMGLPVARLLAELETFGMDWRQQFC